MKCLQDLPDDLIFEIILKLPIESLLSVMCVSKSFLAMISSTEFVKQHASSTANDEPYHIFFAVSSRREKKYVSFHSPRTCSLRNRIDCTFTALKLTMVGSANGLICLFHSGYNRCGFPHPTVILWNPFISTFKILPIPPPESDFANKVLGFGFDTTSLDFKVVVLQFNENCESQCGRRVLVYATKSHCWKKCDAVMPGFVKAFWPSSIVVNGVMHWLAYKARDRNHWYPNCIMTFSISQEVFNVMELPQDMDEYVSEMELSPSPNEKSLVLIVRDIDRQLWVVWLMKKYGNVNSWTRRYVLRARIGRVLLKLLDNGKDILEIRKRNLVLVNPREKETKNLPVSVRRKLIQCARFVPSLALLDERRGILKFGVGCPDQIDILAEVMNKFQLF